MKRFLGLVLVTAVFSMNSFGQVLFVLKSKSEAWQCPEGELVALTTPCGIAKEKQCVVTDGNVEITTTFLLPDKELKVQSGKNGHNLISDMDALVAAAGTGDTFINPVYPGNKMEIIAFNSQGGSVTLQKNQTNSATGENEAVYLRGEAARLLRLQAELSCAD